MLDFCVAFVQISVVHENGIVSFPKNYSIEKGQSWCTRDLFFFFFLPSLPMSLEIIPGYYMAFLCLDCQPHIGRTGKVSTSW